MLVAPVPKDPVVLSYLALRRVVGWVALCLPFVLIVPWYLVHGEPFPSSISGFYYTGMRNLFEGSLCAIAMFNICCRGYDRKDEIAGILSGACAIGVAFFPTSPEMGGVTAEQHAVGTAHLVFASILFLTLTCFCLFLFTMTAEGKSLTRKKVQRNLVYKICGWVILASIALILLFKLIGRVYLFGALGAMFCFETTALIAFGVAWLVKGETFLQDEEPQPPKENPETRELMAGT